MLNGMMQKSPVMPVIGGGKSKMQPVYVKDVAAAFRSSLDSDIHIWRTYELGGPEIITLMQILEKATQVTDKKQIFITAPLPVVAPLVKLTKLFGIKLPVTSDQLIILGEDNIRTGGDPVEELGVSWTPFEEGVKQYLVPGAWKQ
jgi:uncharacterized protein YbjT (DUF2867 family)